MKCYRCCRLCNRFDYNIDFEVAKDLTEKGAILIDVRSNQEYKEGHLKESINIPLYDINLIENVIPDKTKIIVLYCQSGKRSSRARQMLLKKGYKNVYSIFGGLNNI